MKTYVIRLLLAIVCLWCMGCSCRSGITFTGDSSGTSYTTAYKTQSGALYEYDTITKKDFHIEVANLLHSSIMSTYYLSFVAQVGFYNAHTQSLLLFQVDFETNVLTMTSFFNTGDGYLVTLGGPLPANLALGILKESKFITIPYRELLQGRVSVEVFEEILNDLKYEAS